MAEHVGGKQFFLYLSGHRRAIETALERVSEHEINTLSQEAPQADLKKYLYDPLARFIAYGGKRVRPALALLGCEAVRAPALRALSVAVAIERFQSVALIHDDIADHGELRRGMPCLHITEGTGVAINVGDAALTSVFAEVLRDSSLAPKTRLAILDELATMAQHTLEGQALDLGWVRDGRWDITENDYRFMAIHKTAHYSAATPLVCGALCGGATFEQVEALRTFGLHAGLAFQLHDDLLNLVGDEAAHEKDFRSDITEGKRTLLVVWALTHLGCTERLELLKLLSSGSSDPEDLSRAIQLIDMSGAIDQVRREAHALVQRAKACLDGIDLEPHASATLASMADFFIERER